MQFRRAGPSREGEEREGGEKEKCALGQEQTDWALFVCLPPWQNFTPGGAIALSSFKTFMDWLLMSFPRRGFLLFSFPQSCLT